MVERSGIWEPPLTLSTTRLKETRPQGAVAIQAMGATEAASTWTEHISVSRCVALMLTATKPTLTQEVYSSSMTLPREQLQSINPLLMRMQPPLLAACISR